MTWELFTQCKSPSISSDSLDDRIGKGRHGLCFKLECGVTIHVVRETFVWSYCLVQDGAMQENTLFPPQSERCDY